MFDPVDPKQALPDVEEGILQYWREEDIFKRSIIDRNRSSGQLKYSQGNDAISTFSFYDGPPFATGLPHYGHLLAGTIKDVIPRYQTMRGNSVERRFGWDCHGLPIENIIEKENDITDYKQITETMGISKFNNLCRSAVQRYTTEWRKVVERMGRWVDMDWDYRTMDPTYMESMWWAFKQLHEKNLLYEGHKPMHICPRCVTPLSNFEVTQGYQDVTDQSVVVKFRLLDEEGVGKGQGDKSQTGDSDLLFRPPKGKKEFEKMHTIRKKELFERYLPGVIYDENHPDDSKEDSYKFVLVEDNEIIGTLRVDFLDKNRAALRMIAVCADKQGKGIGKALVSKAEEFVRQSGRTEAVLFSEKEATSFYQKLGYKETKPFEERDHDGVFLAKVLRENNDTYILAWTTTPWTLPGNLFLAVNSQVEYVKFSYEDSIYIVAKDIWDKKSDRGNILHQKVMAPDVEDDHESPQKIGDSFKGKELLGKAYEPLFPYFEEEYKDTAYNIVEADFVTTDDGTGVVHIAPGFGEDDFNVGKKEGVPLLQHVSMEGLFTDKVIDFPGLHVKPKDDPSKTDRKIAQWLEEHGKLFESHKHKHSYPHCWRCDSPLLNYATSSWFIAVESIKEKMLLHNEKTSWVPSHIKEGRFGKWLEGARDWAISRNRFWGTPLPIWREESSGTLEVIGSRDELMDAKKIRFTKVTVMRHAESVGNTVPIYQGDEPGTDLTDTGLVQAKEAADWLQSQSHSPDVIYCSPLARTLQTAEAVAEATGAKVIVDERLRELSFGEYEGKSVDFTDLTFVKERRAHKLKEDQPESIYHLPGMETWQSVHKRTTEFLKEVLPRHRSEHIMIVTHADPCINIKHFFTGEDLFKLSHQPYPPLASPVQYFWDHDREAEVDLHKDVMDDLSWPAAESEKSVEVTMVRHGETEVNVAGHVNSASKDPVLTEKGIQQAEELAKALKGKHFDAVIISERKRAQQTAEILCKELDMPITERWKELDERDQGEWGGKPIQEILDTWPTGYKEITTNIHFLTAKGGESLSEYLSRLQIAYDRILEQYAGKKILLVCHSGSMRALGTIAQNLPYSNITMGDINNTEAVTLSFNPLVKRIPEVLDCWFESGSMPYAQSHYPFEYDHRGLKLPPGFPANFIAEGVDQTRAWFYTLMVLSTAIFDDTPFENVVVNGIVLAEDGKKMSKRLQNYPDPMELVSKYGADAIRFTLMSSPAVRAEDLRMSEKLVSESLRTVLLPLWNTYSFFVTYANSIDFTPVDTRKPSKYPLDMWMCAEVQDLINRMTAELDNYDLSATCEELFETIDALTNWYVRLSRRRFAGKTTDEDRLDALHTLFESLLSICQTLAPFCPYITDAIYLNLASQEHGSIHLTRWPKVRELNPQENSLLQKTRVMRLIVSLGNSLRAQENIKNRQPLNKATIAIPSDIMKGFELIGDDHNLLREELNVKKIIITEDPGALADSYVQVDARKVGPRLGARVQEIIQAGKDGNFTINDDGTILVLDETLAQNEASIVYRGKQDQNVAADRGVVVSLDLDVTEKLLQEGQARDIIRTVQRLRKEEGLSFTDTIALRIEGADSILITYGDFIAEETNAYFDDNKGVKHPVEIEDLALTIQFEKK